MKKNFIIIVCIIAFMEILALIIGSSDDSININLTSLYIFLGILLSYIFLIVIYRLSIIIYIKIKFKNINKLIENRDYNNAFIELNNKIDMSKTIDQIYVIKNLSIFIDNDKNAFRNLIDKINKKNLIYLKLFWQTIDELSQNDLVKAKEYYDLFNSIKVSISFKRNYQSLQEILIALFDKDFPDEKKALLIFKIKTQTIKDLLKK